LIIEPYAGGSVAENLNPVGRVYYSFSTFLCVPHAISEGAGADDPLGNQAGEAPHRRGRGSSRIHHLPPGGGNPLQPRLRGSTLTEELTR
jgi:hypothetical protein